MQCLDSSEPFILVKESFRVPLIHIVKTDVTVLGAPVPLVDEIYRFAQFDAALFVDAMFVQLRVIEVVSLELSNDTVQLSKAGYRIEVP